VRRRVVEELPWGEVKAAGMIAKADGYDFVHVANSLAVRHIDMHLDPSPRAQRIFSCRGVNGIDGTLGTFLGELIVTRANGMLWLGDQAFLHDLPALAAAKHGNVKGTIFVMNNGGGGIFDLLPSAELPGYVETIRNPTTIDFAAAAACFGLEHRACESAAELESAMAWTLDEPGIQVVEMRVAPASFLAGVERLNAAMNAVM